MPRYELVDGKSSKFWEVEVEGSDVHLAWGRIGTNGQQKTKSFESAAKAEAERDKLIKQKTKKGYSLVGETVPADHVDEPSDVAGPRPETQREGSPPTASAAASDTDKTATETGTDTDTAAATDTATPPAIPERWRRAIHPRRGYPSAGLLAKPLSAKESWKKIRASWRARAVETWTYEANPEALERARAILSSEAPPSADDPEAHAVAARLLGFRRDYRDKPITAPLVDCWVAIGGLAFATRAAFLTLHHVYDQGTKLTSRGAQQSGHNHWAEVAPTVFPRLRAHLAAADEATHREAVAIAAESRDLGDDGRAVAAFLFPTEEEWVTASVAELTGTDLRRERRLIFSSLTQAAHLDALFSATNAGDITGRWRGTNQLPSLAEGLGASLTPFILRWLGEDYLDADTAKELWSALGTIGGDAPFEALLDHLADKYVLPAAMESIQRYPERAVRLCSARIAGRGKNVDGAKRLLGSVISKSPEVVDAVRGALDDRRRAAIEEIEASRIDKPAASLDALPEILVAPPWTKKTKRAKPAVVKDVAPLSISPKMTWADGEKERWAASHRPPGYAENVTAKDWQDKIDALRAGRFPHYYHELLLIGAPEDVAQEAVKHWLPGDPWYVRNYLQAAVARFELALLEALEYFLDKHLKDALAYIGPYDAPSFAPYVADGFVRLKSARRDAMAWMDRHPQATAIGVIPRAVGKAGKERRAGEAALRYLKTQGHEAVVQQIAADHGDEVRAAVDRILAIDPKDVLPRKIPTLPSFFDAGVLPAPLLEGRERSLPPSAVEHLGTMLALSKPGEEYPGLDEVTAICDRESLARFSWELFEAWQAAGCPSKESWAFTALSFFGDDEVARRLTPLIRKWPGDGGHARAVTGLDVLTAIGSDVALMHLHGIAQKVKFKGLQKNARQKIEIIARERELTAEELADRLVPDLGLDEGGSLVLDYGPRRFTVGFDENLKPFVLADGKPRKNLPKPGVKDDDDKAPAAYARFRALKKDAKTAAKTQILRLELAMVGQRRWTGEQLRKFFLDHPLMIHLSRRLVWARYEEEKVVSTFRVAEDGSLANVEDDEIAIDDDAVIGIVHALDLPERDGERWGEVFGDYEILQPFTQLGRETYAIAEGERKKKGLDRFRGQKVPTRSVIGLEGRGWRRGPPMDAGVVGWMQKQLPGGAWACLNLDPGLFTGYLDEEPEQTLEEITITQAAESWDSRGEVELGALSPVIFSELVRDVTQLTSV